MLRTSNGTPLCTSNADNLSTFNYLSNTVRVVEIDGQPWFVAADVCKALRFPYVERGVFQYLGRLSSDEKQTHNLNMGSKKFTIISESGLYKLIMRSDKPEAREFQDWVTREVLPAIRKDGMYVAGEEKVKTGELTPANGGTFHPHGENRWPTRDSIHPQFEGEPTRMDRIQKPDRLLTAFHLKFHHLRSIHLVNYPYDFECFSYLTPDSWLRYPMPVLAGT